MFFFYFVHCRHHRARKVSPTMHCSTISYLAGALYLCWNFTTFAVLKHFAVNSFLRRLKCCIGYFNRTRLELRVVLCRVGVVLFVACRFKFGFWLFRGRIRVNLIFKKSYIFFKWSKTRHLNINECVCVTLKKKGYKKDIKG